MNMNKILVAGALAAVALRFPVAEAGVCGNGGFYVGVNMGVGLTQAKYRNSVDTQKNVADYKGKKPTVYVRTTSANEEEFDEDTNGEALAEEQKKDGNYLREADIAKATVTGKSLKKNKTKFLAELSFGWDTRVNDVMFGIDVNFGTKFGKSKKTAKGLAFTNKYATLEYGAAPADSTVPDTRTTWAKNTANGDDAGDDIEAEETSVAKVPDTATIYDSEQKFTAKVRNKWNISIMPRVGYLVTPQLELFITGGMLITNHKFTLSTDGASVSKSKTKIVPVLGGGIRYEFSNNIFTKLEYNYNFKAKITKSKAGVTHKFKNSSHDIKLGIGYRF